MPRLRTYECPNCLGRFSFLHHPSDEPPPRYCPLCAFDTQDKGPTQTVEAPRIAGTHLKAADEYFRAMEAGSAHRAAVAMEHHGLDTEQANALKITDMREGQPYGENSAMPVVNEVTRAMAAPSPFTTGFTPDGVQYSADVQTGPFPNAGAHAIQRLRSIHAAQGPISAKAGPTTSDLPALETQTPFYRRRA